MDNLEIRLMATIPMILGAAIMIMTIIKYRQLVNFILEDAYEKKSSEFATEKMAYVFLWLFFVGFLVGIVDTLVRGVEPMYFFITFIFLLGAMFVFFSVQTQQDMAKRLREKTYETLKAFTNAIDMKDAYTKGHSEHVYELVELLYDALDSKHKEKINKSMLLDAAILHDIGKISITDEILNKKGKLTDKEWEVIKLHPSKGRKMLEDSCYKEVGDFVLYHHERIDGTGYYGLKGDEIPIESKIISIADTYSALCTNRIYRDALSHEAAVEIMNEASGTQLDSMLVEKFLSIDKKLLSFALADD